MKGFTARSYIGILAPAKTAGGRHRQIAERGGEGYHSGLSRSRTYCCPDSEVATPEQMKPRNSAELISTNYDAMCEVAELAAIKPT
jgi:hypothetical protein